MEAHCFPRPPQSQTWEESTAFWPGDQGVHSPASGFSSRSVMHLLIESADKNNWESRKANFFLPYPEHIGVVSEISCFASTIRIRQFIHPSYFTFYISVNYWVM